MGGNDHINSSEPHEPPNLCGEESESESEFKECRSDDDKVESKKHGGYTYWKREIQDAHL